MSEKINVFWFRRDLRVTDNMGLQACIKAGLPCALLLILDQDILSQPSLSKRRVSFFLSAVKQLSEKIKRIGAELHILKGTPIEVFTELRQKNNINAVYFNEDYEPYAVKRDQQVEACLNEGNVSVHRYKDVVLTDYRDILKKDGSPYQVFTPYYKKWQFMPKERSIHIGSFKTASLISDQMENFEPSESFAIESDDVMTTFFKRKIGQYSDQRDYPAMDQTSHFSKYLRFGIFSIREIYHKAELVLNEENSTENERQNVSGFIRQLAWRDFYFQLLHHHPEVVDHAFKKKYDGIKWENNKDHFSKWCEGKTGFPFVDAGMRQLNTEGWMHNRLRMITASFLVKDLLIDWRWGAEYFQEKLLDHDLALNNGGWQWCASTGTDAQPYFRIFNPFSQSEKFDPEGHFIRKYVPELRNVQGKHIHRPFRMSDKEQHHCGCVIGKDYPHPIIDHAKRRERAIVMYRML